MTQFIRHVTGALKHFATQRIHLFSPPYLIKNYKQSQQHAFISKKNLKSGYNNKEQTIITKNIP